MGGLRASIAAQASNKGSESGNSLYDPALKEMYDTVIKLSTENVRW